MTYATSVIVLRVRSIREADRLYTVLTPDRGKLELLGQGTRKIESKLAGTLAVPGVLEIHAVRGKAIDRIAGVEVVQPFVLPTLAKKIAYQSIANLVDTTTKHGKADRALFELLVTVTDHLEQAADADLASLVDDTGWRILDVLGYRPRLASCHECGSSSDLAVFDPRGGGALCAVCRPRITDGRPLLPLGTSTAALTTYLAEHIGHPWRGRSVFEAVTRV